MPSAEHEQLQRGLLRGANQRQPGPGQAAQREVLAQQYPAQQAIVVTYRQRTLALVLSLLQGSLLRSASARLTGRGAHYSAALSIAQAASEEVQRAQTMHRHDIYRWDNAVNAPRLQLYMEIWSMPAVQAQLTAGEVPESYWYAALEAMLCHEEVLANM